MIFIDIVLSICTSAPSTKRWMVMQTDADNIIVM